MDVSLSLSEARFEEKNPHLRSALRDSGDVHEVVLDNPDEVVPFGAFAQAVTDRDILK